MKKIILLIFGMIVLSVLVNAEINHYYEINLKYKNGDIILKAIQVKPLIDQKDLQNIEGGYIAEVISFDNKVLNLTFFDIPAVIIYDNFDPETGEAIGGGIIEINETEATIKVPYFEDAKEINIYDFNINKKLTIDVSDYSKKEVKKGQIPSAKQEEDLKLETRVPSKSKEGYKVYALMFFLAIIIIIMTYLYKRLKNRT